MMCSHVTKETRGQRRTRLIGWLLALFGGLSTAACEPPAVVPMPSEMAAAPIPGANDLGSDHRKVAIHVTSNGWHTGIVLARARLPAGAIPEAADFPDAPYLSFGWGDAGFYPAPRPTIGMTLRAALQSTPAVVHMAGLPAHPRQVFPNAEVVELRVSAEGYRTLLAYLDGSFAREGRERTRSTAPGLYSFSLFYPAQGKFHLFNTCNTWVARGLNLAGLPIRVSGTLHAEDLMAQVRQVAARRPADCSDFCSRNCCLTGRRGLPSRRFPLRQRVGSYRHLFSGPGVRPPSRGLGVGAPTRRT